MGVELANMSLPAGGLCTFVKSGGSTAFQNSLLPMSATLSLKGRQTNRVLHSGKSSSQSVTKESSIGPDPASNEWDIWREKQTAMFRCWVEVSVSML